VSVAARPGVGRRVKVLIADDHVLFRQGLRRVLEAEREFLVVGEAGNAAGAVEQTLALTPDILLLDLAMPGGSGLVALRQLAQMQTPTRSVILTAEIDRDEIVKALQLGARGVLTKASSADVIVKALRSIMGGEHWVDRRTVTDLLTFMRSLSASEGPDDMSYGLTRRQLQIAGAVARGLSNKQIADMLTISEDTVKHHLTRIFERTGVANRTELASFAAHHGLTDA
jgi:DNA-binding NarL/FixJ family response regulator